MFVFPRQQRPEGLELVGGWVSGGEEGGLREGWRRWVGGWVGGWRRRRRCERAAVMQGLVGEWVGK